MASPRRYHVLGFHIAESGVPTLLRELLSLSLVSWRLSSTNVKLDTAQTSICIRIGGKLEETLTTHRKVQCAMWMRTRVWILCHLRQELGTCVDSKPISFVHTLKTSLREKGACSVMVSASTGKPTGGFNTRGRRSKPDILDIKIDGQSLTLLNIIGALCHAY